jgi:DNA-binding GntR family transcriptional regulator
VQRARFSAHKTEEQWKRAIDDHNLMVILLKRRDGAALSLLMRDHARNMKVFISAAYSGLENQCVEPGDDPLRP